jgi:hypothetical protein
MTRAPHLALLVLVIATTPVQAQFPLPFGSAGYGALPQATFNGTPYSSGISNANVVQGGAGGVVMGLSATPRYGNPALSNNGAGTFTAHTGVDPASPPGLSYALWNFDFYIGGENLALYEFSFVYDVTLRHNGGLGLWGDIEFPGSYVSQSLGGTWSDSYNLGMAFLYGAHTIPGLFPSTDVFDPNTTELYDFTIFQHRISDGQLMDYLSMYVDVTPAPEPGSLVLVCTGLICLGVGAHRRHRPPLR